MMTRHTLMVKDLRILSRINGILMNLYIPMKKKFLNLYSVKEINLTIGESESS